MATKQKPKGQPRAEFIEQMQTARKRGAAKAAKPARYYKNSAMRDADGLTPQESKFVNSLVDNPNDKALALKLAGYKGWTNENAPLVARRIYNRKIVLAALARRRQAVATRTDVNVGRIIKELSVIGFIDPGELFDDKGNTLPIREMPERVRRALLALETKVTELKGGKKTLFSKEIVRTFKLSPKLAALELMMNYLGILNSKNNNNFLFANGMPLDAVREALRLSDAEAGAASIDAASRPVPETSAPPVRGGVELLPQLGAAASPEALLLPDGEAIDARALDELRRELDE